MVWNLPSPSRSGSVVPKAYQKPSLPLITAGSANVSAKSFDTGLVYFVVAAGAAGASAASATSASAITPTRERDVRATDAMRSPQPDRNRRECRGMFPRIRASTRAPGEEVAGREALPCEAATSGLDRR